MKKSEKISAEIDTANMALLEATQRMDALEQAGDASEQAVDQITKLAGKARLLEGQIARLEREHKTAIEVELHEELLDLRVVVENAKRDGEKALDKKTKKAVAELVPEAGSHPAWNAQFCQRRIHEVTMFAKQHPDVTKYTETASRAQHRIDEIAQRLQREAKAA